jgi:hypothetical protein
MEEMLVRSSLLTTEYKRLFGKPRQRRKIITSSYIKCNFADGVDLAQGACKSRINAYSLCNFGTIFIVGQLLALQEGNAVCGITLTVC